VKNQTTNNLVLNSLVLLIVVFAFLALPVAASADTLTFTAPVTAGNGNSATNNPANPGYNGGVSQFDLDHHLAYSWRVSNVTLPAGQNITGATLTISSIANWDTNPNTLFIHLLNTHNFYSTAGGAANSSTVGWHYASSTFGNSQVSSFRDVDPNQAPVTSISDAFNAANPLAVAPGADNIFIGSLVNLSMTPSTQSFTFTSAQLASLATYIAAGNDFAFGFDSDCHFWNNGISLTISTAPNETPEPATMVLLGSGLAGFGYFQRRRRQGRQQVTTETI
jgi:hypothetical protein